jgi:hypothetical protein
MPAHDQRPSAATNPLTVRLAPDDGQRRWLALRLGVQDGRAAVNRPSIQPTVQERYAPAGVLGGTGNAEADFAGSRRGLDWKFFAARERCTGWHDQMFEKEDSGGRRLISNRLGFSCLLCARKHGARVGTSKPDYGVAIMGSDIPSELLFASAQRCRRWRRNGDAGAPCGWLVRNKGFGLQNCFLKMTSPSLNWLGARRLDIKAGERRRTELRAACARHIRKPAKLEAGPGWRDTCFPASWRSAGPRFGGTHAAKLSTQNQQHVYLFSSSLHAVAFSIRAWRALTKPRILLKPTFLADRAELRFERHLVLWSEQTQLCSWVYWAGFLG